jgi:hypothetical protein
MEDPFVGTGEREMGSTALRDAQQAPETSATLATVSSSSLGKSGPLPKRFAPRATYRHLPGTCVWNALSLFHILAPLVSKPGIQLFLSRTPTLGDLSFCWLVARLEPPRTSSLSKTTRVEDLRVA